MKELYDQINAMLGIIGGFVWGPPMIILLVGTGIFLTFRMLLIQFRGFAHGWAIITGKYDDLEDEGEINHFQALMAALSATIGTGNIVGVAAAVLLGGPGAIFWMWITALVGMATKFTSCTLAVKFRRIDESGEAHGGPMHFIELGMGKNWRWLAILFAVFTAIASFGIGNMFQINNLVVNAWQLYDPTAGSIAPDGFKVGLGIVFAVLTGAVIIGGIKSIGRVAAILVPIMCVFYVGAGLTILVLHFGKIPDAFSTILHYAFHTPEALAGGVVGTVIRQGVARGVFSNEAGLGSAPMAHGAARTREPVREGLVAMLGPFIDTIVICSITGLVIVLTGAYEIEGVQKGELTSVAFNEGLADLTGVSSAIGARIVSLGIIFFAFSTLITWSYYGNRAVDYLFGKKAVLPYQVFYLLFIVLGSAVTLDIIINFSDVMNGLMALPNLIALIALSPVVYRLTQDYFKRMKEAR